MPPDRLPARRRSDDGASLVEFALIAPVLFALLLGMFTGGLALSRKNSMTNAVREGARLGATLQENAAWADAVRARVVEVGGGDLSIDDVCVRLIRKAGAAEESRRSTTCTLPASVEPSSADVPDGQCAVKVWARRGSDFQVLFFRRELTLDANGTNRYERAGDPANCGA